MRRSNEPFPIVLVDDEAIEPSTLGKYLDSRKYEDLKFIEGKTPTVFWGRPLKVSEEDEVAEKGSDQAQYKAAFVRGLMRVTSLEHSDGGRRDWSRPDTIKVLSDAILDDYFDRVAIQEIGMVIRNRSFLGRTREGYFPLPLTSLLVMQAHLRLVAQTTASSTAAETSSPPEAPTPEPSHPTELPAAAEQTKSLRGGAVSGAATATGRATSSRSSTGGTRTARHASTSR
jgi:hypothetical protein